MAVNDILASGGTVAFARDELQTAEGPETGAFVVTGLGREKLLSIAEKYGVGAISTSRNPQTIAIHKARIGLYRPWAPSIDEGWTRWILEKYGFAPESLYNAEVKAGNLRARFDTIILPDMSKTQLTDGFKPGLVPSEYAGGIDNDGVANLLDFVRQGGTLVAFNQTSSSLIDLFGLPVTNILAGVKPDEFFCSGALLRLELKDSSRPNLYGLPADPIVMFERGPAFAPRPGFNGAILAVYRQGTNPLESGVLLHPEKIEGQAAAVEVAYGKGHIFLYGFKPQWRAQSHGAYKFFMNSLYRYDEPAFAEIKVARADDSDKKKTPASAGQQDDDDEPN